MMLNFWTSISFIAIFTTGTSSYYACQQSDPQLHGACYRFVPTKLPWHEAQTLCSTEGGHLAHVTDPATHDFLVSHMPKPTTSYWIGAHKLGKRWKWNNGNNIIYLTEVANVGCLPFCRRAGDNLNHQSPIVKTVNAGYKWNDENGERTSSNGVMSKFICQTKGTGCTIPCTHRNPCVNIDGDCFYLGGRYGEVSSYPKSGTTWRQAKDFCYNHKSVLAEVRDADTQKALVSAIRKDPNLQGNTRFYTFAI